MQTRRREGNQTMNKVKLASELVKLAKSLVAIGDPKTVLINRLEDVSASLVSTLKDSHPSVSMSAKRHISTLKGILGDIEKTL